MNGCYLYEKSRSWHATLQARSGSRGVEVSCIPIPESLPIPKFSQVWDANWKGVMSFLQLVVRSSHRPRVESTPSQTRARHVRAIIWRPRAGTRQVQLHALTGLQAVQPPDLVSSAAASGPKVVTSLSFSLSRLRQTSGLRAKVASAAQLNS